MNRAVRSVVLSEAHRYVSMAIDDHLLRRCLYSPSLKIQAIRGKVFSTGDLLPPAITERFHMLRHQASQRSITLYTMALAAVITVMGLAAAVTMQQMLRRGADQPQIDMTDRYVDQIAAGEAPASVIPQAYVDLQRSLQPVVIFYDDHGRPGPGTGYLDQSLPSPPAGVLIMSASMAWKR
ncbi:MAG TPA: hypothetical protein VFT65_02035 [Candidatus Angelobacter sp.]|nr:hypothetical protein [Candidatus Angelobacter sp.]